MMDSHQTVVVDAAAVVVVDSEYSPDSAASESSSLSSRPGVFPEPGSSDS